MRSLKNKKVLITCGPTWVPIDDMRILSNKSSGTLGNTMASDLIKAGAKVTLLQGPINTTLAHKNIKIIDFCYFDEFKKLLKLELKKRYDIVIHAAAVSDYKPEKPLKKKLSSNLKKLNLKLIPTEKIISIIKKVNPKVFLVGFKLETITTKKSAIKNTKKLFKESKCDLVIANSTTEKSYKGYILNKEQEFVASARSRTEISKKLVKALKQ